MKTTFIALSALCLCVLGVGCSKKNPPKPKDLEDVKIGHVVPVKPELPAVLRSGPNVPSGMTEAQRRAMENESWWKERQRLKALHADAMRRYESEVAEIKRKVEEWQREREREKRNYNLAMEEWYNSLVVCLHCDSDLKTKGAKVCAECGRNQRDGGKSLITDPIVEKAIRKAAKKPTGELTKEDLEKVTELYLHGNQLTEVPKGLEKLTQLTVLWLEDNQLTDVKGLEKLTQLKRLYLGGNKLTEVKGLENLTQLTYLYLQNNPALTKAQIDELQKALPKCDIIR